MTIVLALGIDPGPTTGMCGIALSADSAATRILQYGYLQCSDNLANNTLTDLIEWTFADEVYVQVEKFVPSKRGGGGAAGKRTRDLVGALVTVASSLNAPHRRVIVLQQPAVTVKAWATNERLKRAKLEFPGSTHARDAGRHALYAACHDAGLPDPFSRKARRDG